MVNSSKLAIGTWLRFYEYIYPDLSTEEFFIKDAYNYIGSNLSLILVCRQICNVTKSLTLILQRPCLLPPTDYP